MYVVRSHTTGGIFLRGIGVCSCVITHHREYDLIQGECQIEPNDIFNGSLGEASSICMNFSPAHNTNTHNIHHTHTSHARNTQHIQPLPLEVFGKDSRELSKESVRVWDPLFVENSKRHPLRRIWGMRCAYKTPPSYNI